MSLALPIALAPLLASGPRAEVALVPGGVVWLSTVLVGVVLALLTWRVLVVLQRLDARVARLEDEAHRIARAAVSPEAKAPAQKGQGLARVEGLLEDLRDVQRRLDDRLSALAERASAPTPVVVSAAAAPGAGATGAAAEPAQLVERALNRLLALGYEQVEVVTPRDAVDPDGSIIVEARRSGAIYKGAVRLSGGAVADVALRPSHDLFP
jgi:hypothetical protein